MTADRRAAAAPDVAAPPAVAPPLGPVAVIRRLRRDPLLWPIAALPLAALLALTAAGDVWVFLSSAVAIIPLAGIMGRATEQLAATLGPGPGGLLNATFGNAAELVIGLLFVARGPAMYPVVKASLTGSIIGNLLLILGMAALLGGLRHRRQQFNRRAAAMGATLLALASIGLIMPTTYQILFRDRAPTAGGSLPRLTSLSEEIAVILVAVYALFLLFSLWTHRELYGGQAAPRQADRGEARWSRAAALWTLLGAMVAVALMGELMVGAVADAGRALGFNQIFLGVVVIATIGNAAEHSTAVLMARRNRMELAVQIAIGSSLQIALFVAPVLVFASALMGNAVALDLHFTALEVIAVVLAVGIVALVAQDGETNWMEGVMLVAVYAIIALAFYNLPTAPGAPPR